MLINIPWYLWLGFSLLVAGSVHLIIEAYLVYKIFNDSIIGRLVKMLVAILVIELYSLGTVSFAFLNFNPRATMVLLPIVVLWIATIIFAILAVRDAKKRVMGLTK